MACARPSNAVTNAVVDTPEVRYARRDGGAIAYQVWGSGPLVTLFITEWPGVSDVLWEHPLHLRVWRHLSSFGRVIRVDRNCIGSSDPGPIDDLDAWAEDLVAVLDAEEVPTCAIAGEAWGGHAGIVLALNHPERVDRLLLMNSFVSLANGDGRRPMSEHAIEATAEFVRAQWGTGAVIDASAGFGHEYLEWSARYERTAASPSVAADMVRAAYTSDVSALLASIECPTLVLYSAAYTYIGEGHSRMLASGIEGAEYIAADTDVWYILGTEAARRFDEFLTGSTHEAWSETELAVVVFSDIVDSTAQLARRGDREWRTVLDDSNDDVVREVSRFGGRVVKHTGDGHLMTFTNPGAALAATQAIRRDAHALGFSMRFGVHMGAIERRDDGDIAGMTVHAAARVAAMAGADEIVVSRVISDLLVGTGPEFVDLGPSELKGVPTPMHLFSVRGPTG